MSFAAVFICQAALAWIPVEPGNQAGPYTVADWKAGWPGCEWEDGVEEGRIHLVNDSGVSWLRVLYPKGSVGSEEGGAGWRFPLPGVAKDNAVAELRYTVVFEEDFDFVKGGKLPGLCGGPETITGGDEVTGREGWSARVMWRKEGRGQAYVYHMNQPEKYGDEFDFPDDFRFIPGRPTTIRMRVTMNTPGKRDGILGIHVTQADGPEDRLVVEKKDMEWRAVPGIGVDSVLFNTFHGGNGSEWAPSRDCHARFSGFAWRRD